MMDIDTKLIAILRRQYHIILTALGENIFRIGLSRERRQYVWVIDQARGQDGWILAKFFFVCLWTETKSRSINSQKKNEANIQPP